MDHASDIASKLEQALEINLKKHDAIGSWEMHKFLSHSSHNILRMHSLILRGQYSASNRHWKRYLYPRGYLSYSFDSFSSEKLQSSFLQDPDYQLFSAYAYRHTAFSSPWTITIAVYEWEATLSRISVSTEVVRLMHNLDKRVGRISLVPEGIINLSDEDGLFDVHAPALGSEGPRLIAVNVAPSVLPDAPSPSSSDQLLKVFEEMLAMQLAQFDASLAKVVQRVKQSEKYMLKGLTEVQVKFDKLEARFDAKYEETATAVTLMMRGLKKNEGVLKNVDTNALSHRGT
ncbi:hypothetical protein KSP40_PGU000196 [Platanthera guangdongensis]|uniref:Uncharacterized protein n=1 Tax=Platanthera guangdongensis TaxID=2320717 RepID=A0ABR2LXS3_9ASPA